MMHETPWAGRHPLSISDEEVKRFLETIRAIEDYLNRPPKQKARHRWIEPQGSCADCGVTRRENAAVKYGCGIPCRAQSDEGGKKC